MQASNTDNSNIPFRQLKKLLQELPVPTEPIPYKEGETITNVSFFLNRHFTIVEANSGKRTFLPYYKRLLEYYRYIIANK